MTVRRVLVANVDGQSQVVTDGAAPRSAKSSATPGFEQALIWTTTAQPSLTDATDATPAVASLVPGPGETRAICLTIPPDTVFADPAFDPAVAGEEFARNSPGLAEFFEPDAPGMHTTPTVDYAVVVQGELWLETTQGETHLRTGDVVVQIGTRHAWRNKGTIPATMFGVLIGASAEPAGSS